MDEHAEWLSEMARQGWHYKGQDFVGFQHFESGAPAEMAFCWDQTPLTKSAAFAYRQKCREAGWEMAASFGRWLCWSISVVPGQPGQPLRDKAGTLAMLLARQRQCSLQVMLLLAMMFLQFPNLFGTRKPLWLTIVVLVCLAAAVYFHARDAIYAKARVRQLEGLDRASV